MNTFITVLAALLVRDVLMELYQAFRTRAVISRIATTIDSINNNRIQYEDIETMLGKNVSNTNRITKKD